MALFRAFFFMGPLIFGIGFIAPLIDQSLQALNWSAPLGLSTLTFGLTIGAVLGAVATVRGSWV